ncbi:GNAT family N-acetyltransferase [Salinarimonas soli]|uniref:GNAT family N-acetyltransferase n=1 Tax=Salinarimonas soli TaxID=1638099 RepID=A0A5B2VES8_9HYPH|nr:GNAT family N-acetyltransferase [Salinarimonas soli]KAA2236819.1 GNAT family N-acetyltransferase [Salinarimonas soli]
MPDAAIRRAGPADAPAIRALVRAAYGRWMPLIGREPTPMNADYDRAVREHRIDLLLIEGALAALIETTPHPDHLYIHNLAVAPERQGRGLGRRLLAHAEAEARLAGLPELRLLTNAAFASNVRLYEAEGFRVDRTEPFMGGTTVHMSKALGAGAPRPDA